MARITDNYCLNQWFAAIVVVSLLSCCFIRNGEAADIHVPTETIESVNQGPRYILISIGVNDYQDDFWPSLKWPTSDATRVATRFGRQTGHRLDKTLLINDQASLQKVKHTLQQVATRIQPQDTLVLYVSGHGSLALAPDGEMEQVVVLHDTRSEQLVSTGLSQRYLRRWLEQLEAQKKLMIFATCHAGEGKSRLPPRVRQLMQARKGDVLVPLSQVSEGALILAASAQGEVARENDGLQGDIYTHYLLEALETYDRNRDGMVSAMEAHDYARERTWAFSQGKQRPTAHARFIGDADIPLQGKKQNNGLPVLEAYDERLSGFYVQVDGGEKGRLPFAFPLSSTNSRVVLYGPQSRNALAVYRVKARPGQTLTLQQVMDERPYKATLALSSFNWRSPGWQKLASNNQTQTATLALAYQLRRYAVGLSAEWPVETNRQLDLPVNNRAQWKAWSLNLAYRYPLSANTWWAGVSASLGRETMEVDLRDTTTVERAGFTDDAMAVGVSAFVDYHLVGDIHAEAGVGWRTATWDLGLIGELEGDRLWFYTGLSYRFGGAATTVW